MNQISFTAIVQWIGLLQQIVTGGTTVWDKIKAILVDHGIDADTAALDAVILDAAARKAQAQADATPPPPTV